MLLSRVELPTFGLLDQRANRLRHRSCDDESKPLPFLIIFECLSEKQGIKIAWNPGEGCLLLTSQRFLARSSVFPVFGGA